MDSDLLVLRGFLSVEGGFWPFFRRVFDRTFHHDFLPSEGGRDGSLLPAGCLWDGFIVGIVPLIAWMVHDLLLVDDSYKGLHGSKSLTFQHFPRCLF